MKKLLLITSILISSLTFGQNFKGSKIIGVGGNGGFGGIQGLTGQLNFQGGKFLTNRLLVGGEMSFHRKDFSKTYDRLIQKGGIIGGDLSSIERVNRSLSLGVNARYFLNDKKARPYFGLATGVYRTFPKTGESLQRFPPFTQPYIKASFGIMSFFGKKEQYYFDAKIDLTGFGKSKVKNNIIQPRSLRTGLNLGFGIRF